MSEMQSFEGDKLTKAFWKGGELVVGEVQMLECGKFAEALWEGGE